MIGSDVTRFVQNTESDRCASFSVCHAQRTPGIVKSVFVVVNFDI